MSGPPAAQTTIDTLHALDVRIGTVVRAEAFPEAKRPAYKLWIDCGPEVGVKASSAQITANYELSALLGRKVACVVNFPPRRIGPFTSEVLTLGFPDARGEVVLVGVDRAIPNGGRLY